MGRSYGAGGGAFTGAYHAFREECNRYAKQKLIQVNNNINMVTMTYNEIGMEQLTSESFGSLLEGIDTFICGADGFLWLREGVILEASSLINMLIENKKEIIILTNDTTKTRANHEQKLKEHRFSPKLTKDHIITPGLVAADFIKKSSNFKGIVYVIASEGVQDDFASSGIKYFGERPDLLPHPRTEAHVFTTDLSVKVQQHSLPGKSLSRTCKSLMAPHSYLLIMGVAANKRHEANGVVRNVQNMGIDYLHMVLR
uniref:Phosphatase n=1 Tax=Angiostrongylus cantonensis TaxID=6313 RepID=A0A0K0D1K5_ANGCA